MLVFVFGAFGEVFEASFGKALQALSLRKECRAQPAFDASLADTAGEAGDCGGTASDADVRVFAVREDAVGDDATSIGLGQLDELSLARGFFVEDCAKLGLRDGFLKGSVPEFRWFSIPRICFAMVVLSGTDFTFKQEQVSVLNGP